MTRIRIASVAVGGLVTTLVAMVGPTAPTETSPEIAPVAVDTAAGASDASVTCGLDDLVSPTQPTPEDGCLAAWWSFRHYLATLPRLP